MIHTSEIKLKFDSAGKPIEPVVVLATRSCKKLGTISADDIEVNGSLKNGYELSFVANKALNPLWDEINDLRLVWIPEWDIWFEISVKVSEANYLYKDVLGTSLGEAELSQIIIRNTEINTENDIARSDYKPTIIYNPDDPSASLLDRVMEKAPHYKIGHVDMSIAKMQRTFTFNDRSLRDVLNDITDEVDALMIIDSGSSSDGSISRSISIYDLKKHCGDCGCRLDEDDNICPECGGVNLVHGYGEDSGIFVCSENLSSSINLETNVGAVKNCFKLVAGDDVMTAAVTACCPNGNGYLWYISDKTKSDMSEALRNKLEAYDRAVASAENREFDLGGFPSAGVILKYNDVAKKYNKSELGIIEGFSSLQTAVYDTIDFALYIEHGMMPKTDIPITTASEQMSLLINNLSPVSVQRLDFLSSSTASSYVNQVAKAIIDPRYNVTIKDATLNGSNWHGSITITRYSDESDTATNENVSVTLNDDYKNFIKRLIDRVLNTTEYQEFDIVSLFKLNESTFGNKIKEYGLSSLRTLFDACQSCLNVLIERGAGDKNILPEVYEELYTDYYNKQTLLQNEINVREDEASVINSMQKALLDIVESVHNELDFEKYLGTDLWTEFSAYRREDTYKNENYISDGLSNAEILRNAKEFLATANKEIIAAGTLQHSINSTLYNLMALPEFKGVADKFKLGNWIRVRIDDKVFILRLLEYRLRFDSLETIDVTYSDVLYDGVVGKDLDDIKSMKDSYKSMASSYGEVSKQASHGNDTSAQLRSWVSDGLEVSKIRFLDDAVNQNMSWGKNGMLFRKYDEVLEDYSAEQLRIINSTIAVTDDSWESVKTAVGGFDYLDPVSGEIKHGYGINAELLIGKLILGEELGLYNENNSLTFDRSGLKVSNNINSFEVSPNGGTLFSVTCKNDKVMWLDEDGALHLKPKEFSLTTGETLQDAIDAAKKAQNLQIVLTNEYEGIPTDCNGNYTGELSVKTGVITFYGQVDVTNDCMYTISKSDGITGNWNLEAHEYTITALTTDCGYIDITAKYKNVFTITKRFNVSKVKAGSNGKDGISGKTTYLHIKYTSELKDDRSQIIMTEIPSAYIGTLTDFTEKDSNNPADYTWSKFQGVDGKDGEDGIQGVPGADGKTTYFHSKYMTKDNYAKYEANHNDPTVVMTELAAEYMGTYVDYVEKDSESPKTYTWMKVQGTDGIPGTNGADGRTSYLHIKYSDDGGITFTSNNGEDQGAYIGQYVDFIQADSNNPADYKWSRIEGIDGEDGQPGVSNYFHVKYSHIEHPLTSADMTEIPDDYIGTYVDEVKADSNDPKKYTWTRFRGVQGENGEKGIPGKNGEDGTTYYLHIKYMTADNYAKFSANNNDTSVVMTETPSEYIGQLVDTTEADSNVAKDYKWSRIEGIDGQTYTLEVSANSIKRNPNGSLTPNQLTLRAFRRDGKSSQRVPIQAYYFIFPTADGTNYTGGLKSTSPNSSYTFNLSEIATENTIAFKVLASETTSQADAFDTQTIPILRDGKDGKDGTEMTPEEMFNKLTDNGTKQGLYMSDDGDIYFNAEYIKSGTISALNIEGCNISATLGDWVANYNAAGMSFWDNTNSKTKFSIDRYMTFSFGSTSLGSQPCIRTDYLPLMGSTNFGFYNLLFAPYGLPNVNGEYTPGVIWVSGGHGINMSSFEMTTPDGQYILKHNLVIHGSTQYGLSNGMYLYPVAIDDSVFSPTIATNTLYTQSLNVTGGKYRVVDTDTYGVVSMSAVESATPMFMDTGSGCIGNDGKIDILYDEKFSETIDVVCESQVFITPTSAKKINYIEKHTGYFTVYGDADATFDWIVYCPQKGYTTERMENAVCPNNANVANIDETIFEQNGSADFATQEDMKEYTSISQNLLEEGEDSNL